MNIAAQGKRLDGLIDEQSQTDRFEILACLKHFGKIHLDHDGIHHEEETDRNGNGNDRASLT